MDCTPHQREVRRGYSRLIRCRAVAGFTLLEILVAIAVIALLSAMVVPACLQWIGEHRFREALVAIEVAVGGWRTRALRDGQAFVVTIREGVGTLELCAAAPTEGETPETGVEGNGVRVAGVARFEALRTLSRAQDPGAVSGSSKEETARIAQSPEGTLVCVILPDGSVAGPRKLVVADAAGREAEGTIDRWSGEVRWSRAWRGRANPGQQHDDAVLPERAQ